MELEDLKQKVGIDNQEHLEEIFDAINYRETIYKKLKLLIENLGDLSIGTDKDIEYDYAQILPLIDTIKEQNDILKNLSKSMGIETEIQEYIGDMEKINPQKNQSTPISSNATFDMKVEDEIDEEMISKYRSQFPEQNQNDEKVQVAKEEFWRNMSNLRYSKERRKEAINSLLDNIQKLKSINITSIEQDTEKGDSLETKIYKDILINMSELKQSNNDLSRLLKTYEFNIKLPLLKEDLSIDLENKKVIKNIEGEVKKAEQSLNQSGMQEEKKPEVSGKVELSEQNNKQTRENNSNKMSKDETLKFTEEIKDIYIGKNPEVGPFRAEDKIFFANATIGQIKRIYGDRLPKMTEEQEKLFNEYIKYMAKSDGYYLEPKYRQALRNFKDFGYDKTLNENELKAFLNSQFFKNGNERIDDVTFDARYKLLIKLAKMPDETWKEIDSAHNMGFVKEKSGYKQQDSKTNANMMSVEEKEIVSEDVKSGIVNKQPDKEPDEKKKVESQQEKDNTQSNTKTNNSNPLKVPVTKIVVKGNKMFVDGKEMSYDPNVEWCEIGELQEFLQKSYNIPLFGESLKKMQEELFTRGADESVKLDPNIVLGIIRSSLENEEYTNNSNGKTQDLIFKYLEYVYGYFEKGSIFNNLDITYNLSDKSGLNKEQIKSFREAMEKSKNYATIIPEKFGFFKNIIQNIKGRITTFMQRFSNRQPALGEGENKGQSSNNPSSHKIQRTKEEGQSKQFVETYPPVSNEEITEILNEINKEETEKGETKQQGLEK